MVMKQLIRKILREETDFNLLKSFITKSLEKQVNSGEIPKINFLELRKRGLSDYQDEIYQIYHDFVGGLEEAFKLFKKYIDNKIITDDDIRKIGRSVDPNDHYKVEITGILNLDYRGKRIIGSNEELEFGFELLDGQFDTNDGILTLEELYDEEYDDIWVDVTDILRSELEDYVWSVAEGDFGLIFSECTSHWND